MRGVVDGEDELQAFEEFFGRASKGLVGQAYLLTGDLQEAQDLAQEALSRAWDRWPQVSRYDDPVGWTRRVLHNLAISGLRRRVLERRRAPSPPPPSLAGPDADAVDLVRALRRLPAAQRKALVLHEVVGLTNEEVAREMRASTGTVRKWLHRARTALLADLGRGDAADWERPRVTTEEVRHG